MAANPIWKLQLKNPSANQTAACLPLPLRRHNWPQSTTTASGGGKGSLEGEGVSSSVDSCQLAGQFSAWLIISAARVIKLPICSFGNYPNKLAAIQRGRVAARSTTQIQGHGGDTTQCVGNERAIMRRGVTTSHRDPSSNLFSFRAVNTLQNSHSHKPSLSDT